MLCIATLLSGVSISARAPDASAPLNPGLTEGVESRLAQFEVRATRRGVPVAGLAAEDFDIDFGGRPLEAFILDDMCTGASVASRPGSFIFYFDEAELTTEGRRRALEIARLTAPAILKNGHDVLILRNGGTLQAETTWTHDAAEVTAALDRIAGSPSDTVGADTEELQAQRLIDLAARSNRESALQRDSALADADSSRATGPAKCLPRVDRKTLSRTPNNTFVPGMLPAEREAATFNMIGDVAISRLVDELADLVRVDLRRTEHDMERLRGAVCSLSLRASPKGVVYFADTLRRDPGAAVARAVDAVAKLSDSNAMKWRSAIAGWSADSTFEALVRDAETFGVRFLAVEGRGLVEPSD